MVRPDVLYLLVYLCEFPSRSYSVLTSFYFFGLAALENLHPSLQCSVRFQVFIGRPVATYGEGLDTQVNAAICTTYVDRHQTINDFARDAISRFPNAEEIHVWLGGDLRICYVKSENPGEWKNSFSSSVPECSILRWSKKKEKWMSDHECHQWVDNFCDDFCD